MVYIAHQSTDPIYLEISKDELPHYPLRSRVKMLYGSQSLSGKAVEERNPYHCRDLSPDQTTNETTELFRLRKQLVH